MSRCVVLTQVEELTAPSVLGPDEGEGCAGHGDIRSLLLSRAIQASPDCYAVEQSPPITHLHLESSDLNHTLAMLATH